MFFYTGGKKMKIHRYCVSLGGFFEKPDIKTILYHKKNDLIINIYEDDLVYYLYTNIPILSQNYHVYSDGYEYVFLLMKHIPNYIEERSLSIDITNEYNFAYYTQYVLRKPLITPCSTNYRVYEYTVASFKLKKNISFRKTLVSFFTNTYDSLLKNYSEEIFEHNGFKVTLYYMIENVATPSEVVYIKSENTPREFRVFFDIIEYIREYILIVDREIIEFELISVDDYKFIGHNTNSPIVEKVYSFFPYLEVQNHNHYFKQFLERKNLLLDYRMSECNKLSIINDTNYGLHDNSLEFQSRCIILEDQYIKLLPLIQASITNLVDKNPNHKTYVENIIDSDFSHFINGKIKYGNKYIKLTSRSVNFRIKISLLMLYYRVTHGEYLFEGYRNSLFAENIREISENVKEIRNFCSHHIPLDNDIMKYFRVCLEQLRIMTMTYFAELELGLARKDIQIFQHGFADYLIKDDTKNLNNEYFKKTSELAIKNKYKY